MSKAPAFQFYVKDWLSAPEVRRVSAMSRGVWIDLLCFMWLEEEQGRIRWELFEVARATGVDLPDVQKFLSEAQKADLCDVEIHGDVTNGHTEVTLTNRRMHNEWKDRYSNRIRKQKQRSSQPRPTKVTPPSSSASSSASAKKEKEESSLRSDSCAEVKKSPRAPKPASPPDDSKIVGTLPLADGSNFEVRQSLVDEFSPLYPAVDVIQAFRSMKGWLVANPRKRKTGRGIRKFIASWLDREQDRGGTARGQPLQQPQWDKNMFMGSCLDAGGSGNG